jgi:hypothetical protein
MKSGPQSIFLPRPDNGILRPRWVAFACGRGGGWLANGCGRVSRIKQKVQAGVAEGQPAPKQKQTFKQSNNQTAGMAPAFYINNYNHNYCTHSTALSTKFVMPAENNITPFPLLSRGGSQKSPG